jgi:hypothetical protein
MGNALVIAVLGSPCVPFHSTYICELLGELHHWHDHPVEGGHPWDLGDQIGIA